jgi:hypothetical protein
VTTGVIFDGTGAIARTANGSVDWDPTLFAQGMQGIDFPKPETGLAVGFVGTILRSTDLGNTWSAQSSGTFADLFDVHFASDGLTGIAVGAAGHSADDQRGGKPAALTFSPLRRAKEISISTCHSLGRPESNAAVVPPTAVSNNSDLQ